MGSDTMDLVQLATYLQRDVREVSKLASRGHLPGRKVGGEWRFARAEINHWLETQLSDLDEQQLTAIERGSSELGNRVFLTRLLLPTTDSVAAGSVVPKKFQARRPERMKIGN